MLDFLFFLFIENKVRFICYNLALSMLFILLYIRYIMKVITDFNRLLRLSIVVCEVRIYRYSYFLKYSCIL